MKKLPPNLMLALFTLAAIFASLYLTMTVADTIARYALSVEFTTLSP